MFANSKKVTTFATAIEREILDKKDGPFVYRLGRKIFILERGVRFPHGLPNKKAIDKSMAFLFGSPALCRVSSIAGIKAQFENGSDSTDPENLGESLTPIDICLYSCLQTYSLTLI